MRKRGTLPYRERSRLAETSDTVYKTDRWQISLWLSLVLNKHLKWYAAVRLRFLLFDGATALTSFQLPGGSVNATGTEECGD